MSGERRCWCGSGDLAPFDGRYLSCRECETLIVAEPASQRDGWLERGYGRDYWFRLQEENQRPNLSERSSADLSERCPHWLRAVLRHKLPPGRALDLGCGHGGFVALLRWAGFDAVGLELDPWVVEFARDTFHVPVLRGPIEEQALQPGSFDLICAMDVLEHLPDPEATIRRCFELLRRDGILVVQTPCRPAGKELEQLATEGNRFLEMLLPDEHLFLFGERAVRELLRRQGARATFAPAIFEHYDMFLFAGREPLAETTAEAVRESLGREPTARAVSALLALDAELAGRSAALARVEEDGRRIQRQNQQLTAQVTALESQALGLRCENRELRRRIEGLEEELAELRALPYEGAQRLLGLAAMTSGDSILPASLNVLFEGWSAPEGDGQWRWSDGHSCSLIFRAGESLAEAEQLLLEIEAGTYEPQRIEVWLNGVSVGELRSDRHWEPSTYELVVPSPAIEVARRQSAETRFFEVKMRLPGARLVADGERRRRLGLCLRRLTLRAV